MVKQIETIESINLSRTILIPMIGSQNLPVRALTLHFFSIPQSINYMYSIDLSRKTQWVTQSPNCSYKHTTHCYMYTVSVIIMYILGSKVELAVPYTNSIIASNTCTMILIYPPLQRKLHLPYKLNYVRALLNI